MENVSYNSYNQSINSNLQYSCFYNSSTVITKNGSLLKIIKINSFKGLYSLSSDEKPSKTSIAVKARAILQAALYKLFEEDLKEQNSYIFWINTVRKPKKAVTASKASANINVDISENFTDKLLKRYQNELSQADNFTTEIYITILTQPVTNIGSSLASVFDLSLVHAENKFKYEFNKKSTALDKITEKLLTALKDNFPRVLSAERLKRGPASNNFIPNNEENNGLLNALSLLASLEEQPELTSDIIDLSQILAKNIDIFFGYNTFELTFRLSNNGQTESSKKTLKKKFGAILEIKNYQIGSDLDLKTKLLNLNLGFIITEILTPAALNEVKNEFDTQVKLLAINNSDKEDNLAELSDLTQVSRLLSSNKVEEFCYQNLTITLFTDKLSDIDSAVSKIENIFLANGIFSIRYDLLLENAYYSSLPGNISFLPPRKLKLLENTGSFAATHTHFSNFKPREEYYWGDYITKFLSLYGELHFFSFHVKNQGHTIIIGPKGAGKTILQNFLLAASYEKFKPRIFILDPHASSELFVSALGGSYYNAPIKASGSFKINLLDMADETLLTKILLQMKSEMQAGSNGGPKEKENVSKLAATLAEKIVALPPLKRNIENLNKDLEELLGDITPLKEKFSHFFSSENIFSDNFNFPDAISVEAKDILGIRIEEIMRIEKIGDLIVFYLLNKYLEIIEKISEQSNNSNSNSNNSNRDNNISNNSHKNDNNDEDKAFSNEATRPFIIVLRTDSRLRNLFKNSAEYEDFLNKVSKLNGIVIFSTDQLEESLLTRFSNISNQYIVTKILLPARQINYEQMKIFNITKAQINALEKLKAYDKCFFLSQGANSIALKLDLSNYEEKYVISSDRQSLAYMQEAVKQSNSNPNLWLPIFYQKIQT